MNKPQDYTYSASLFEPGIWLVKREDRKGQTQEAQVYLETEDHRFAIRHAIENDSWA